MSDRIKESMRLRRLDNKFVRLFISDGSVYDGVADYCSRDYNEVEYGARKDGLMLSDHLFYRDSITDAYEIDEEKAGPYGLLEQDEFEYGLDCIGDLLTGDDGRSAYRLLHYVKDHMDEVADKDRLRKILDSAYRYWDEEENMRIRKMIVEMREGLL